MVVKVHGLHPWDELTRVSKLKGPRYAAIAFIGADAPNMLALEEGDVLVCNAGRSAIESGATNPHALKEFFDRGVTLYNCESLHAKMLAVENSAAVGSANASRSSSLSLEAAVVSNERAFISDVHSLIEKAIAAGTGVAEEYLNSAISWIPGRKDEQPEIVGVTAVPPREDVFFPEPGCRYWMAIERQEEYSDEEEAVARSIRRSKEARLFKTKFTLDTYLVEGRALAGPGDVFILLHEDEDGDLELVWEPAKVVSCRYISAGDPSAMYLLRYNEEHNENAITDINYAIDTIRDVTSVDLLKRKPGAKAIKLSEQQGDSLISEFWG